jgi:hypothetical protein
MNDEHFLIDKGKIRLLPPKVNINKNNRIYNISPNYKYDFDKILDQIPIKEIEQYLRKKKLNNIFND